MEQRKIALATVNKPGSRYLPGTLFLPDQPHPWAGNLRRLSPLVANATTPAHRLFLSSQKILPGHTEYGGRQYLHAEVLTEGPRSC